MPEHQIVDAVEIGRMLTRISTQIIEHNKGIDNLVLVGVVRRGDVLAHRLAVELEKMEGVKVPVGAIDITLYRDDLKMAADMPIVQASSIPFDIDGKIVILVDDVLYTGRTVRAEAGIDGP